MAINSSWINSALFLIIWLFSTLVESSPKGSTIIRGRKGEQSYDFSGGESEGGIHMSEETKLMLVVAGSIILFLLLFCFCCIFIFYCVNKCKSTAPDNVRIDAEVEDQQIHVNTG